MENLMIAVTQKPAANGAGELCSSLSPVSPISGRASCGLSGEEELRRLARESNYVVGQLAVRCKVSRRSLELLFQRQMGQSPGAWLQHQRPECERRCPVAWIQFLYPSCPLLQEGVRNDTIEVCRSGAGSGRRTTGQRGVAGFQAVTVQLNRR
jgi:hypothetical protein